MRLNKLFLWMLLCGPLAFVASNVHAQPAASRVAGRIIAAKVQGTVLATNLVDNTERTLKSGDELSEKYEIKTAPASSVILVFANGATANVGADSVLRIEEFLMDPFAGDLSVSDMKEEPTSSKTSLNLTRGEMVGNVKHLRQEKGSTFTVNTPVGAAGIRGTTFRIVFRPDATGKMTFTLSTAEGTVLMTGNTGAEVSIGGGKELAVEVEVKVDATTGVVTILAAPILGSTKDISVAAQASIATAVQQIVETAAQVIISSTSTITTSEKPKDEQPKDEKPKDEKPKDETPKKEELQKDLNNGGSNKTNTTSGDGL